MNRTSVWVLLLYVHHINKGFAYRLIGFYLAFPLIAFCNYNEHSSILCSFFAILLAFLSLLDHVMQKTKVLLQSVIGNQSFGIHVIYFIILHFVIGSTTFVYHINTMFPYYRLLHGFYYFMFTTLNTGFAYRLTGFYLASINCILHL